MGGVLKGFVDGGCGRGLYEGDFQRVFGLEEMTVADHEF